MCINFICIINCYYLVFYFYIRVFTLVPPVCHLPTNFPIYLSYRLKQNTSYARLSQEELKKNNSTGRKHHSLI